MHKEKTPYQRRLADPRWQMKRLKIFERDGAKCVLCKSPDKELHVHHCWYEKGKKPWEYPDECYVTLCFECHELETEYSEIFLNSIVNILKRKGYLYTDLMDVEGFFKSTDPKQFATCNWLFGISECLKDFGYDTKGWIKEKLKEIAQDDKP